MESRVLFYILFPLNFLFPKIIMDIIQHILESILLNYKFFTQFIIIFYNCFFLNFYNVIHNFHLIIRITSENISIYFCIFLYLIIIPSKYYLSILDFHLIEDLKIIFLINQNVLKIITFLKIEQTNLLCILTHSFQIILKIGLNQFIFYLQ